MSGAPPTDYCACGAEKLVRARQCRACYLAEAAARHPSPTRDLAEAAARRLGYPDLAAYWAARAGVPGPACAIELGVASRWARTARPPRERKATPPRPAPTPRPPRRRPAEALAERLQADTRPDEEKRPDRLRLLKMLWKRAERRKAKQEAQDVT